MTSAHYQLAVKDVLLFQGYYPDDDVLSIFREQDRIHSSRRKETYLYRCPVQHLCDRLDVMGFRLTSVEASMAHFVREQISLIGMYRVGLRDPVEQERQTMAEDAAADLLNKSTFVHWRDAYIRLMTLWNSSRDVGLAEHGPLDRYLYRFTSEERDASIAGIRSPFGDARSTLRATLSAFDADAEAYLDCSQLLAEEWIDPNVELTALAIDRLLAPARATEPIVVLTEGPTDTRLLSRSMEKSYPHLRGFYTFLDHEGFSPPAGTGNIGNLVKGLAASGISNRVVALFDNDSAGTVAASDARNRGYPKNFRILQLPPLERGKSYPTLGPSGLVVMDINGKACSLELYLGESALSDENGALVPILWTSYDRKLRQYQGELSYKQQAQERYLNRLKASAAASRDPDFDDMRMVLRTIMDAFAT